MDEKISLPKPPRALMQQKNTQEQQPQENVPDAEQTVLQESVVEQPAFVQDDVSVQEEKKEEKKKIDFAPIINWVGLMASVALFGVFVFLLVV